MCNRNLLMATAIIAITGTTALAHTGATGIVKQRMESMKIISESLKQIGVIMKGEAVFDVTTVQSSATTIATHANSIPDLFPEGTTGHPSEALPAIWTDWERFTAIATRLSVDAQAMSSAASSATDITGIRDELVAVGRSCKACHQDFRMPK